MNHLGTASLYTSIDKERDNDINNFVSDVYVLYIF